MSKIISGVLLSIFVSCHAHSQHSETGVSNVEVTRQGVIYVVAENETLSSISQKFTGQTNHWRAIGSTNQIQNDRTIPIGKKLLIPFALLSPVSAYAKIKSCFGQVSIRSRDGSFHNAKAGEMLREGDTLTTLSDGFISLALDDGTQFTLPPNSAVTLKLLRTVPYINSPRTELLLQKGRVKSQVTPFVTPESRYEVQSPLAVSGVRGTRFRVQYNDRRQLNEVIEGKVAVNANGKTAANKSARLVPHGFGAIVENGRVGKPIALLSMPTVADGYQNQQRLPIQFFLSHPSASAFRITISTDAAGILDIAEARANSVDGKATAKLENLEDGEYFMHYSAVDGNGLEGLSGTLRFRVNARPFPPFLLNPGAKFQAGKLAGKVSVPMQWSQADDATGYRIQISTDAAFTTDLIDQTITPDATQLIQYQSSLKSGTYYWRVATIVNDGKSEKQGPFGDTKRLEILDGQPAPAATVSETETHFSWSASVGQRFTFQLATSPSFAVPIKTIETAQSETTLTALQPGTYYARVRSIDDDGFIGAFSPPQKFEVPARWQTDYGSTLQSSGQPVGTGF